MTLPRLCKILGSAALVIGLSGCAAFPRLSHWVDVKPARQAQASSLLREDGYYSSATMAMSRRDYARALELLQSARAQKPDDVRVLNAFGVIYDKLGRFDLSARYYEQARALDPTSSILAANMAYSVAMQTTAARIAPAEALIAQAAPAGRPVQQASVVRLSLVAAPRTIQLPGLTGRPLELADASGRADVAELVRRALQRQGWSVSASRAPQVNRQAATSITYPSSSQTVARALARTLPGEVAMVDCLKACDGIRLLVGADAARWFTARTSSVRGD